MESRYWYLVLSIGTPIGNEFVEFGYISNKYTPFNLKAIKENYRKETGTPSKYPIAIINSIEFANEEEYVKFWEGCK